MNDRQAIAALKRGDIRGLETLVLRYQVEAVRTAYGIVGDAGLAEDIAQTAFLRLTSSIAGFDEARRFAPWFMRIVARDAIAAARRGSREAPLDQPGEDASDWLERLASREPPIDAQLEQAQTSAELWALLETLSPEQRAVVVLHFYSDLRHAEIAQRLDVPEGTIRSRLHAAIKQLRRLIARGSESPRPNAPISGK